MNDKNKEIDNRNNKTDNKSNKINKMISEGSVKIKLSDDVFYNPHMELCRDISSLAVGAIGKIYTPNEEKLRVCDGFSATGIRGIRYAVENKDIVESLTLVDANQHAISLMEENLKLNNLRTYDAVQDDIVHHVYGKEYNFIEIDPFGTPRPFLDAMMYSFRSHNKIKTAYLSVTATDPAVLCGAHYKACLKLYHSIPLDNFFCHETGIRILLANISWSANQFDFGIEPLFSLSHRHYMKTIIRLKRGAKYATENTNHTGYITYCPKCLRIMTDKLPFRTCKTCGNRNIQVAGPLWLGEIHNRRFITAMLDINKERDYKNKEKLDKLIRLMQGEVGMPPYYYNTHQLAKQIGKPPVKIEQLIKCLNDNGYLSVKTHFDPIGIKTKANIDTIKKCF
ncbi:tRNA (guanine(10)-N(2))-dimethyltransferase [Candidatus Micrarchaeota archaeon]|nr:tRNA (guanine(10)-N(2))-dimethyltransferase [Candidatus Micrarchaeota archaeon]